MHWATEGAKIKNHGRMCHGCAFKDGTPANESKITIEEAAQCLAYGTGTFHCHLEDKICTGYAHAKEFIDKLEKK